MRPLPRAALTRWCNRCPRPFHKRTPPLPPPPPHRSACTHLTCTRDIDSPYTCSHITHHTCTCTRGDVYRAPPTQATDSGRVYAMPCPDDVMQQGGCWVADPILPLLQDTHVRHAPLWLWPRSLALLCHANTHSLFDGLVPVHRCLFVKRW